MDYLGKNSSTDELFKALEEIICGRKYVSREVIEIITRQAMDLKEEISIECLSEREIRVTGYVKQDFFQKKSRGNFLFR